MAGRINKSMMNAEVNLLFYFLSLFLAFYSRNIFLKCLGNEFVGLTGTLGNILGYLNLAELGIGGCISIFLYKPLHNQDREQINEIISIIGYLYRRIGLCILCAGIVISAFFPLLFGKDEIGLGIVYFAYYSFLGSSLIGYFINYRQILLSADQKNYVVSAYFQTADLIKKAIQIYLAYHYMNLYLWVAIEFVFGVLSCIILNWKINKEYPWLTTNKSQGKKLLKKYPSILVNTKQIFIHQIKDFILSKSDELFVFLFVSLEMVAFYGNYTIIITKVTQFFSRAQDGIGASVGNLIAENDAQKIIKIFWELMSIKYLTAGFLCFSIYHFTEPFVTLWLGEEYVLSRSILVLLVVYVYLSNIRGVIDMYNHAYGLYADTWSAWAELIVNVSITIIFGIQYGIIGLLLGKIVSVGLIVVFWKPYYLFTAGLKKPISIFWKGTIRYHLIFIAAFIFGSQFSRLLPFCPTNSYVSWILYCICSALPFLLLEVLGFYFLSPGTKSLIARFKKR